MSIYQEMLDAGVDTDHHESDLYARVTPESERIVSAYRSRANVRRFIDRSRTPGVWWFDIPFAYLPFWENRPSR